MYDRAPVLQMKNKHKKVLDMLEKENPGVREIIPGKKDKTMNRKEHTEEWTKARATLEEYGKKEKLTYNERCQIIENENSELKRNMFIESSFKSGRISEAEFYRLGKMNTTNRLLKALVLLELSKSDKNLEGWLIDLED